MIRGIFWIAMAYAAGAFAFSIASILSSGLGTDAIPAIIEGVISGLLWPVTFFELVTGRIGA